MVLAILKKTGAAPDSIGKCHGFVPHQQGHTDGDHRAQIRVGRDSICMGREDRARSASAYDGDRHMPVRFRSQAKPPGP